MLICDLLCFTIGCRSSSTRTMPINSAGISPSVKQPFLLTLEQKVHEQTLRHHQISHTVVHHADSSTLTAKPCGRERSSFW